MTGDLEAWTPFMLFLPVFGISKIGEFAGTPNNKCFYGCYNWMIPNHYIQNGCFTKPPLKNGCLGFQVVDKGCNFIPL